MSKAFALTQMRGQGEILLVIRLKVMIERLKHLPA
jgi:hypothetical protein